MRTVYFHLEGPGPLGLGHGDSERSNSGFGGDKRPSLGAHRKGREAAGGLRTSWSEQQQLSGRWQSRAVTRGGGGATCPSEHPLWLASAGGAGLRESQGCRVLGSGVFLDRCCRVTLERASQRRPRGRGQFCLDVVCPLRAVPPGREAVPSPEAAPLSPSVAWGSARKLQVPVRARSWGESAAPNSSSGLPGDPQRLLAHP